MPVNLNGKTLFPGFIDAHGYIFNARLQALAANLLASPDGIVGILKNGEGPVFMFRADMDTNAVS